MCEPSRVGGCVCVCARAEVEEGPQKYNGRFRQLWEPSREVCTCVCVVVGAWVSGKPIWCSTETMEQYRIWVCGESCLWIQLMDNERCMWGPAMETGCQAHQKEGLSGCQRRGQQGGRGIQNPCYPRDRTAMPAIVQLPHSPFTEASAPSVAQRDLSLDPAGC